jgi:hypothetical protein
MSVRDSIRRATARQGGQGTPSGAATKGGIDLVLATKLRDLKISLAREERERGHALIDAKAAAGKARIRAMCAGWRQEDARKGERQ